MNDAVDNNLVKLRNDDSERWALGWISVPASSDKLPVAREGEREREREREREIVSQEVLMHG